MLARLGNVIYWLGAAFAAFMLIMAGQYFFNESNSMHALISLMVGSATWAAGWMVRYILSGNKSIR